MPNAQGGYTYEEEQEAIARAMQQANWNPGNIIDQNPTVEQQNQQVANNMAAALRSQNAELTNQDNEQRGLLDMLGTTQQYGAGPPYTASVQEYNGPPPMEAQPDWNYDSGYPGDWHDYNSNNVSTGGGFFNFEELFHDQGKGVPTAFSQGANRPSTNNYRLLPPEYRKPNYIMRNGWIIDTNSSTMYGPQGYPSMGAEPGTGVNPWRSGVGVGSPVAFSPASTNWGINGWPGAFAFTHHSSDSA